MEFKYIFDILQKYLSDGEDAPSFFRELISMLTEMTEVEWGGLKDPSQQLKPSTIRSYLRRGVSKAIAKRIVYRLNPDNLSERINELDEAVLEKMRDDLRGLVPDTDTDTVGDDIASLLVENIQRTAGLVPQDKLTKQREQQVKADLKLKFGDFLLGESGNHCPFPGCGKELLISGSGKVVPTYEVNLIEKDKPIALSNLMSLEYGLYPKESDLSALHEYFPGIAIRKLYDVENYHKKLAKILDQQFSDEKRYLEQQIEELRDHVKILTDKMQRLGVTGTLSKEFLDRHSEIKGKINVLKEQNAAYLTLTELKEAKSKAASLLRRRIEGVLADIQEDINRLMKKYNDTLYKEHHKAPHLIFREYNSYMFETPDDTGTGTNYKGMVLYDLSVLALTSLPAIAHDSLILKNVSDGSIEGIMKIYERFQKQIFISFDKQDAYQDETRRIVRENTVLKLSDNGGELYGYSWNMERGQ